MSSSFGGGAKFVQDGIQFDDAEEKKHWQKVFRLINKGKIKSPEYDEPLDKMPERAMPEEGKNIIKVKGSCPPPLKACDARAAQKAGRSCPDPRYAAYPYIQVKETGALCYPNLNTSSMIREMQENKKALARKSILDLIKVLAAIEDNSGTPGMCNVIHTMNAKPKGVRKAYCTNLKDSSDNLVCNWNAADNSCAPSGASARRPVATPIEAPSLFAVAEDIVEKPIRPTPTAIVYIDAAEGEEVDLNDDQLNLLSVIGLNPTVESKIKIGKVRSVPELTQLYLKLRKNIKAGIIKSAADVNQFYTTFSNSSQAPAARTQASAAARTQASAAPAETKKPRSAKTQALLNLANA